MKTHHGRLFFACILSCGLFAVGATRLRADEPQGEAPKPPAPATEVTVPVEISGVATEIVANLNGVLLQVAAQTDSVLGVNVKPVDDVLRSHLGLAEGKGFVVTAVAKESGLANADLRVNDVLLTVGGEEISSLEMLSKTLRGAPDKPFTIGIMRAGKKESIEIKPGSLEVDDFYRLILRNENAPRYRLGVGLADADETLRSQLSLLGGEGLVVTSVENDSPAAKSGVLVNDVLIKLDGKALTSIDVLQEHLQQTGDKAVSLELMRRRQPATLTVTPEKQGPWGETLFLRQSNPLYVEVNPVPLTVWARDPVFSEIHSSGNPYVALSGNPYVALNMNAANPEAQVAALLEQVKQLQASLESLQAALKTQPQPSEGGEKK